MALLTPSIIVTSSSIDSSDEDKTNLSYAFQLYPYGKFYDIPIRNSKVTYINYPVTALTHSPVATPLAIISNSSNNERLIMPPFLPIIDDDIFYPSLRVDYGKKDVCDNENVRNTVIKIIYSKLIEKWLYNKYSATHIHNYLKLVDGKVVMIKKTEKPAEHPDDANDVISKIKFVKRHLISPLDIHSIISKFVEKTGISWCDVVKSKYTVEEVVLKSLHHKLQRLTEHI